MNEYREFLRAFIKLLGAVNLYSIEHPASARAAEVFLLSLGKLLEQGPEITIGEAQGKPLVNATAVDDVTGLQGLFSRYEIHSITFLAGVTGQDVFGLLRALKAEAGCRLEDNLHACGARNIRVNSVHYVKKGEAAIETAPVSGLAELIDGMTFDGMIRKVIERAVPDEKDRARVYEIVLKKFQGEVDDKISEATLEIKREKEEIKREKEKTERVISGSVLGEITVDGGGNVLLLNHDAELMVGSSLVKKCGRPVWESLQEGQMVTYAPGEGGLTTNNITVIGEDETKRLIQASSAIIRDIEGRMVGLFSALSDRTQYKELDRMKREFVANVTHELRTPIVAIKQSLTNIMELTGDLDDDQKGMLAISIRNTERLLRLVNDILDFSKIEAGRMKLNPEIIETLPFLKETVQSLVPFARSKGVELLLGPSAALPRLFADRDRTNQILVNLLSNAIKFTPPGGNVTVEVPGGLRKGPNTFLKIAVRDTGRGIEKADLARVFEKFVQVGARDSTAIRGTGLGLTITKSIVELHGGSIDVQSEPGVGSTFSVALPMLPEDQVFLRVKQGEKDNYIDLRSSNG